MTRIEFDSKSKAAKMVVALAEKGIPSTLHQHGWFVGIEADAFVPSDDVEELALSLDGKILDEVEER